MRSISPKYASIISTLQTNMNNKFNTHYLDEKSHKENSIESSFHQLEVSHEAGRAFAGQSRALLAEIQESQNSLSKQELEERIVMLLTENERLQRLLQEQEEEVRRCRMQSQIQKQTHEEKLRQLEQKTTKLIYENDRVILLNDSLTSQIENLQQDFHMLRQKHQMDTEQIQTHWKTHYEKIHQDQQQQTQSLQSKIQSQTEEITRLNQKYSEIQAQNQNLLTDLQNQCKNAQEMNQYVQHLKQTENQFHIVQEQLKELKQREYSLQNNLKGEQDHSRRKDSKIESLTHDVQEINKSLCEKQKENESLKQKLSKSSDIQAQNQKLNNDIQNLCKNAQEMTIYVQHLKQIESEYQIVQKQLEEAQQKEKNLYNNFQVEQDISKKKDLKIESQSKDIQQLNRSISEKQKEADLMRQKFQTLQKESQLKHKQLSSQLELKLNETVQIIQQQWSDKLNQKDCELQGQNERIKILTREIKKSKEITQDKLIEMEQIKPQYYAVNIEVEKLRTQIITREEEAEKLRQQIIKLQNNFDLIHEEDGQSLRKMSSQNENLSQDLKQIKDENQRLRQKCSDVNENLLEASQTLQESQQKMKLLQHQIQVYSVEVNELRSIKDQLALLRTSHKQEIELLQTKFEQSIKIKLEKEINQEREKWQKYGTLQLNDIKNYESKIQSLMTENEIIRKELIQIQNKFQGSLQLLEQENEQFKKQMSQLYSSKEKYKNRALSLEKIIEEQKQTQCKHIEQQTSNLNEQQQIQQNYTHKFQKLQEKIKILKEKLFTQDQNFSKVKRSLEDEILVLRNDNRRLIDEKASQVFLFLMFKIIKISLNTHLETKIKRMTPTRNDENYQPQPILRERKNNYGSKRIPSVDHNMSYDFERTPKMMHYQIPY